MSQDHDRALEEEARSLLREVRVPPPAPAETRARAMRRLALALPATAVVTGAGAAVGPAGRSLLARAIGAHVPAWSLLASFAAGGALALAVTRGAPRGHEMVAPPVSVTAPPAPREEPRSPVAEPALPPPSAAPAQPAPPSAAPVQPSTRASAAERPATTLEAERALLDVARTALGRGDGAHALRATEEHARAFPHGQLAEEREAMAIQALRLLHRDEDASARLDRFRARFPASLIRPALEASGTAADGGAP